MQMPASLGKCVHGGNGDSNNGAGGLISLPEDIISEVLVRLPARSLCRFRCVCKAWRAVISDPAFVAAQRSRAGPLMAAVFESTTTTDERQRQEVRLLDMRGNVLRVFDVTCGSTALLARTLLDLIFVDRAELGAMVIDPASGREYPLPSYVSIDDYSFGRAVASGDYKVLRLVASAYWPHRQCEVITIMDGGGGGAVPTTWRQRPWGPFHDATFSSQAKASVNGVLYFLLYNRYYAASHPDNRLAAFDLDTEVWRPEPIKCPPLECEEQDVWQIALSELKGTLCVVQNIAHYGTWGGHYVNLWFLMDPNESIWVQEYRIQMPLGFLMSTKPLYVLGDGTILLLASRDFKSYFLQFYNSSIEDFTDIMEMAHGFDGIMTFYTGSLLSYLNK